MIQNTEDTAKRRLQEISKKNEKTKEYSLGDVLLLNRFEKDLEQRGYGRKEIEALSPSYYDVNYHINNNVTNGN